MRAPLLLKLAALTAFTTLALPTSSAAAATPSASVAPAGIRAIARAGEAKPWLFVGRAALSAVASTEPKVRAAAVVRALAPETAALTLVSTEVARFGDGDRIVRFEQSHLGLPVIGRGATVRLDARGESVVTALRVERDLPASIVPRLSAQEAANAAQRFTKLGIVAKDAHLVIASTREGARLAYVVIPVVPFGLPTAPRMIVDATDGHVIEARDLVVYLNQAKVYETNPIASPTLVTKELEIDPDGTGSLKNDFVQSGNCVDNKTVKTLNIPGVPIPITAHVCDVEHLAVPDANGDFLYDPIDDGSEAAQKDAFSEVSMYHHVAKVYSFFRTLQGDPTAQVVVDKPLPTISNLRVPAGFSSFDLQKIADPNLALVPFQNAFFSPAGGGLGQIFETIFGIKSGGMFFGQGPTHDYSYDGDVVYHEFTHAVVDKTLQLGQWHLDKYGVMDSPGAMNEGLADYFSSALAGDPNVGEYASKDIDPSLTTIRTLDNKDTCGTVEGEVHWDSTVFSGGLWKARTTLSDSDKPKYDAALYKAMRSHAGDGDLGYEDLIQLFLASLQTDLPAGATALTTEMTARGLLPECPRIFDGAKTVSAPVGVDSVGAFAGPGADSLGVTGTAPGMLQVKLEGLGAGQTHVNVSFFAPTAQQGANPLGGGGTPFTPVVLAKFGGPIQWTTTGALKSDATATVTPKSDGKPSPTYTAAIDIPAGAANVYVQIANKGGDGYYTKISLATDTIGAPEPDAGAPTDDAGTDNGASPGTVTTTSGCSCHTTPSPAPTGLFGMAVVGALALLRRRRAK